MISIKRESCPDFLRSSESATAYRDARVVKVLWHMQHEKCCYCEVKIPGEGHGKAVEHWHPKAIFKGKMNEWDNLLLACPHCNGAKAEQFPIVIMGELSTPKVLYLKTADGGDPAIIDPSDGQTDPEDFIDFVVELNTREVGLAKGKSRGDDDLRGQTTIEVVGLYRDFYRQMHARFIRTMMKELCLMGDAEENGDELQVTLSLRQFEIWVSTKNKYSAVARAFARRYKIDTHYDLQIPSGWN